MKQVTCCTIWCLQRLTNLMATMVIDQLLLENKRDTKHQLAEAKDNLRDSGV